nr:hypothetical protein [Pandoravirus aubagnensis]
MPKNSFFPLSTARAHAPLLGIVIVVVPLWIAWIVPGWRRPLGADQPVCAHMDMHAHWVFVLFLFFCPKKDAFGRACVAADAYPPAWLIASNAAAICALAPGIQSVNSQKGQKKVIKKSTCCPKKCLQSAVGIFMNSQADETTGCRHFLGQHVDFFMTFFCPF